MTIRPCTCSPVPVTSSLSLLPGAVLKDFVDGDGRWHAVVLNYKAATNTGDVRKQSLIAPSAAYRAAHPRPTLPRTKQQLVRTINQVAQNRVQDGPGFEYPPASNKFFSLSLEAQVKWNGLHAARAALTYPVLVRTKDDLAQHSIADAADLVAMHAAAVTTAATLLEAARSAKSAVIAAADVAAARAAARAYLNP